MPLLLSLAHACVCEGQLHCVLSTMLSTDETNEPTRQPNGMKIIIIIYFKFKFIFEWNSAFCMFVSLATSTITQVSLLSIAPPRTAPTTSSVGDVGQNPNKNFMVKHGMCALSMTRWYSSTKRLPCEQNKRRTNEKETEERKISGNFHATTAHIWAQRLRNEFYSVSIRGSTTWELSQK